MASVSEQMCWNIQLHSYRLSRHCQILMSLGWQCTCIFLFVSDIFLFLILSQQLEFAGRWKNVPILFLETNSNFDFVLYLSHIRKCNWLPNCFHLQCFLGHFPLCCVSSIKRFVHSFMLVTKIQEFLQNLFCKWLLKRNGFITFDT